MNKKNMIISIIMMLLLTGCSLAQPSKTIPADHKMVGIFITVGEENKIQEDDTWVTLGSEVLETEVGALETERKVLIGKYDEKKETYTFGQHQGFLCLELLDESRGYPDFASYSDLDDITINHTSTLEEDGIFNTDAFASGTLYLPEKVNNESLCFYNVFQSKDGTIYLDGSIHSTHKVSNHGFSAIYEYKTKEKIDRVTIDATIQLFSNSTDIIIYQYDSNGNLLERKSIGVPKVDTAISWLEDASYVVVEEINEKEDKRVIINKNQDEENPSYTYHIADEKNLVKTVELQFKS